MVSMVYESVAIDNSESIYMVIIVKNVTIIRHIATEAHQLL